MNLNEKPFFAIIKFSLFALLFWMGLIWLGVVRTPTCINDFPAAMPLVFAICSIAVLLIFWKQVKESTILNQAPSGKLSVEEITDFKNQLRERYNRRESDKLAGRFPLNLKFTASTTGTSEETVATFKTLHDHELKTTLEQIFYDTDGRLLIIGQPGAGKTTLLLQLAQRLLEHDHGRIPVLLNLATWQNQLSSIEEWLDKVLDAELSVSKLFAKKILRSTSLILLLDGLDEVPDVYRDSCLNAIGEYGKTDGRRYVLTSRPKEYEAAGDVRNINFQIEVEPLTREQLKDYLVTFSGSNASGGRALLKAIERDELLYAALENPFYLNTAQLLFTTKTWSELEFKAGDVAGRQREIVDRFVTDALNRTVTRRYAVRDTQRWLGFWAEKMNEEGLRRFELGHIWAGWVSNRKWWYRDTWDSLIIMIYMLLWGTLIGAITGVLYDIDFYCFLLKNGKSFLQTLFYILEIVKVFGYGFKQSFIIGMILGCVWSFWTLNIRMLVRKGYDLKQFLSLGILIFFMLLFSIPGWREFGPIGILYASTIVLPFWILLAIHIKGYESFYSIISVKTPYQRFRISLNWMNLYFFEHFVLRLILTLRYSLPLRLVYFLNEMSRRHLLEFDGDLDTETGGGVWRWRHRILQEWFLENK